MVAKLSSAALRGLDSYIVEVQVDVSAGFPSLTIVGLPDAAIQESKERIRLAIRHADVLFPDTKVVVNLAPADLHKEGPSYDLPIALAILTASHQIPLPPDGLLCVGELSLDGKLSSSTGMLSIVMMAKQQGFKQIIVPAANAIEAALVSGINVLPAKSLPEVLQHLKGEKIITPQPLTSPQAARQQVWEHDFAHIKGHAVIKRALEIVAAGGHHILLFGPPGSGKTILAKTVLSILPSMTAQEILEVTRLYSIAGLLTSQEPYCNQRPFRDPHHSASMAALVGGGRLARPGEISLAHHGVLYLDELPEFGRGVIEALRQPLEERTVTVARAEQTITYPAQCIFVGSLNPCPCGYFGDTQKECVCTPQQITKYQKKISGPVLDRMDLCCYVPRIDFDTLANTAKAESSASIQERIEQAVQIQRERYKNTNIKSNAYIGSRFMEEFCQIDAPSQELMKQAMQRLQLSPRSYHRLLRVSRTIADLEHAERIEKKHLSEALQYRQTFVSQ